MRKTIAVKELVQDVNAKLALSTLTQGEKEVLCTFLANWLHKTGNYRGFSYNFDWNSLPVEVAKAKQFNRTYFA